MNELIISEVAIKQDAEGRYCLNDLHRAAGGQDKHRPTYWMKNQLTQDLMSELEIDGIPSIQAKQGLGTFVCKDLVYSYAMWISPRFHLQVIRAYDSLVSQPYLPQTYAQALRSLAQEVEAKEKLLIEAAAAKPKVEFYDEIVDTTSTIDMGDCAKMLRMGRNTLFGLLRTEGVFFLRCRVNHVKQIYINQGLFRESLVSCGPSGSKFPTVKITATAKGLDWLRRKLQEWGYRTSDELKLAA